MLGERGLPIGMGIESGRRENLDFFALLAELHVMIGQPITLDLSGAGRPVAVEARGRLVHLCDLQLELGSSVARPGTLTFTLDGVGLWFSLREPELVLARAFSVEGPGRLEPTREVQIVLRGGLELWLGLDDLVGP